MKNKVFFKSSLMVAPISETDLAFVYGGAEPSKASLEGKRREKEDTITDRMKKAFLIKMAEKFGESIGNFLWLVPATAVAALVNWKMKKITDSWDEPV